MPDRVKRERNARRFFFSCHAGRSMTAAPQPRTSGPARRGQSRFAPPSRTCRRDPSRWTARPANRLAGRKTAPGIFLAPARKTRQETVSLTLGTHQESSTYVFVFAPGCAVGPNSGLYASTDDTMALRALASRMGPTLGDMRFKEASIGVGSWILGTPGKFDDGAAAIVDFAGAMDNPLSPYSLSQGLPSNIFSKALADRIDVAWEAVDRTGGALSNGAGDVAQNFLQSYKNLMNRADGPFQAYTVVQTQTYTRVSSFFGLFHRNEWVDGPRTYTPVNTGPLGGFFVTPSAAASAARAALIQQLYNGRF